MAWKRRGFPPQNGLEKAGFFPAKWPGKGGVFPGHFSFILSRFLIYFVRLQWILLGTVIFLRDMERVTRATVLGTLLVVTGIILVSVGR